MQQSPSPVNVNTGGKSQVLDRITDKPGSWATGLGGGGHLVRVLEAGQAESLRQKGKPGLPGYIYIALKNLQNQDSARVSGLGLWGLK